MEGSEGGRWEGREGGKRRGVKEGGGWEGKKGGEGGRMEGGERE